MLNCARENLGYAALHQGYAQGIQPQGLQRTRHPTPSSLGAAQRNQGFPLI
jgi:hypothetical protein